jgi:hypothetical protein
MNVAFTASSPCALCGYLIRLLMTSSVRINRRSMRTTGVSIGAFMYNACPECGTPVGRGGAHPRTPYVLMPEDAAKVGAYRLAKWGDGAVRGSTRERVPA